MLLFLTFWILFPPKIGYWGDTGSLLSIALMIVGAHVKATEPAVARKGRTVGICLIGGMFLYSAAIYVMKGPSSGADLYYTFRFLRAILHFLGCYALARLYYRKYGSELTKVLLVNLYWAIAIHAAIMCLMFFVTPIREAIGNIIVSETHQSYTSMVTAGKRIGGLVGGLDGLSVVQAFGLIVFPSAIVHAKKLQRTLMIAILPLILFSVFISGRTGFVIILSYCPFLFLSFRQMGVKKSAYVVVGVLFILLATVLYQPSYQSGQRLETQWDRILSLWSSLTTEQNHEEGAVGKLLQDYTHDWPTDLGTFLFGSGYSGRGGVTVVSADPGYILDVHAIGIIGTLPMVCLYCYMLFVSVRYRRFCKDTSLLLLFYTIVSLLVNGKVRFLLARVGFPIEALLCFGTLMSHHWSLSANAQEDILYDEYYAW
ncbi:MAG: hypothetical protein JXM70_25095 [Pirellulales bacterium]|nr:hypothetical protein [Pirellulales bacterium]